MELNDKDVVTVIETMAERIRALEMQIVGLRREVLNCVHPVPAFLAKEVKSAEILLGRFSE